MMGRVLPFARSAEQVRSLAVRRQEKGNPLTALELLLLSHEKSPLDAETIYSLARTYASMECRTLSNRAYFSLLENEVYAPACLFGMGENFYAMQLYATAHDCLALALQKEPFADFAPEAVELLEAIGDAGHMPDPLELRMQKRMQRVIAAMDGGKPRLAIRLIRRVLALNGRNAGIYALYAFSLLGCGDTKEALIAARKAYRIDPHDVRVLCALASALKAGGNARMGLAVLKQAQEQAFEPDDAQLVCQTACEMGEHALVVNLLSKEEEQTPHAEDTLRTLAVALYNTGDTQGALRRWRLLRRIHPLDSVATYLIDRTAQDALPRPLAYSDQVPLAETLARLERLRIWVQEGEEDLARRWREDDALLRLLYWGLYCGEAGIPQAMCSVLTTLGDERARTLLRNVLCDINIPRDVKRSAMTALFTMGDEGPFYAVMEDRLTLVHVSAPDAKTEDGEHPRLGSLYRRTARLVLPQDAAEQNILRALCRVALSLDSTLSMGRLARATGISYCHTLGIYEGELPRAGRRRIRRVARQINREGKHALHQL